VTPFRLRGGPRESAFFPPLSDLSPLDIDDLFSQGQLPYAVAGACGAFFVSTA